VLELRSRAANGVTVALPPDVARCAMVCSFECTFCLSHARTELKARPARPVAGTCGSRPTRVGEALRTAVRRIHERRFSDSPPHAQAGAAGHRGRAEELYAFLDSQLVGHSGLRVVDGEPWVIPILYRPRWGPTSCCTAPPAPGCSGTYGGRSSRWPSQRGRDRRTRGRRVDFRVLGELPLRGHPRAARRTWPGVTAGGGARAHLGAACCRGAPQRSVASTRKEVAATLALALDQSRDDNWLMKTRAGLRRATRPARSSVWCGVSPARADRRCADWRRPGRWGRCPASVHGFVGGPPCAMMNR
jgi:hypothetical protein